MTKGDRVTLKDGTQGIITGLGMSDFIGDPFPVYLAGISGPRKGEAMVVFSNELEEVTQ